MHSSLILQLSDLHLSADLNALYQGLSPLKRFQSVLSDIKKRFEHVDLLLLTGDLGHQGASEVYQWLIEQTQGIAQRMAWIPGNHDDAALMKGAHWPECIQLPGWQLLLLDSTSEPDGRGSGALAETELAQLEQQLQTSEQPTMLVLHHNPLPINSGWQDPIMLANADQLWQRLTSYPQIRLMLHGHIHQRFEQQYQGVQVLSVPACAPQFKAQQADFTIEDDAAIAGPAYRWLQLFDDGRYQSDVVFLDFDH